ncbi:hypothetical protein KTS45_13185 [Halomicroarcula limicola]|uniref:Alpha/beta hydrolase n=1 Tax=Haloarcula limicola TaxID=1429915 RepID=A0A8J8C4B2_9EURY|nr:hypothetical protein [Halomicroarcula limicola]MBV0925152.1 hypothetical protein [Halomicroarcula limicola]
MVSRRQFVGRVGGAVAALSGIGTVAGANVDSSALPEGFPAVERSPSLPEPGPNGPPAVPESFPTLSTYGHFEDDASLAEGKTRAGYDLEGDWSGFAEASEIQIYVHGFVSNVPPLWARYLAKQASEGLAAAGYTDAFNLAFNWDSNVGWVEANEIAERNALKFAQWVRDLRAATDRPVRIVSHSLGARVVASLLEALHPGRDSFYPGGRSGQEPRCAETARGAVDSVALLGAAIGNESVQTNERWGTAIQFAAGELYNYFSRSDGVLEGNSFLGYTGIAEPRKAPNNYVDRNVTDSVAEHGDYDSADNCAGVLDEVVADLDLA